MLDTAPSRAIDRVRRTVTRVPDAVAIEAANDVLTYAELWDFAEAVAGKILSAGVAPGERVVVAARPGPSWVAAMLGIWWAGAVYVPVDTTFPRERLCFVAADSSARVVLSNDEELLLMQWPKDARVLRLPCPTGDEKHVSPACDRRVADSAYAIYTSGTTGTPKAVLVGHEALAHRMSHLAALYALSPADRIAQISSPTFDASLWDVMLAFEVGACLCIPTGADRVAGPALTRWLAAQRVTAMTCTPSVLAALPEVELPALRLIALGGEQLHPRALRHWITRHQVANPYGPTEATIEAIVAPHVGMDEPAPIGRPLPGVHAYVLDQRQTPVPAGGVGELYLGGAGLAHGYLGQPALTAQRFPTLTLDGQPHRVYRTGDLVRLGRDGQFEYHGRTDRQLNIGGVRVEPGEIEHVLTRLPQVRSAAVVATTRRANPVLAAHLTTSGQRIAVDKVRRHLRAHLPAHSVPAVIVVHDRLPLTMHGKTDLAALAELLDPSAASFDDQDLQSGLPGSLTGVWATLTGSLPRSPNDDFFDAGGHSLAALRLVSEVNERLGTQIIIGEFLADPTPAGLLNLINRTGRPDQSSQSGLLE